MQAVMTLRMAAVYPMQTSPDRPKASAEPRLAVTAGVRRCRGHDERHGYDGYLWRQPHRRLLRDRKRLARRGIGAGVKIRLRAVRRRRWSAEDKLRIVRETLGSGAVANWHGTSTGLLFTSRKEIGQRG